MSIFIIWVDFTWPLLIFGIQIQILNIFLRQPLISNQIKLCFFLCRIFCNQILFPITLLFLYLIGLYLMPSDIAQWLVIILKLYLRSLSAKIGYLVHIHFHLILILLFFPQNILLNFLNLLAFTTYLIPPFWVFQPSLWVSFAMWLKQHLLILFKLLKAFLGCMFAIDAILYAPTPVLNALIWIFWAWKI